MPGSATLTLELTQDVEHILFVCLIRWFVRLFYHVILMMMMMMMLTIIIIIVTIIIVMNDKYIHAKETDSKLLLIEIPKCRNCLSVGCQKSVQRHRYEVRKNWCN